MAEYLASIFGTEKDKVNCSFYFKIGACRHGDRCSRIHNKPTFSQTILLQNLYQNPQNVAQTADGTPTAPLPGAPQMSDEEAQEHFDNFFEDVFVELEDKYGEIEEMNVCDNLGDHLVGNVYVKFRREEDADKAVKDLNNRWFGQRPIYAELSPVTDFREACCRQYEMGECTRSGFCNFMHLKPISRELRKILYGRRKVGRRSRSKSRDRSRERRRRSRSREREHRKSGRNNSKDRSRRRSRERKRSRSPDKRSKSAEKRSRSKDKDKRSRSQDRDRDRKSRDKSKDLKSIDVKKESRSDSLEHGAHQRHDSSVEREAAEMMAASYAAMKTEMEQEEHYENNNSNSNNTNNYHHNNSNSNDTNGDNDSPYLKQEDDDDEDENEMNGVENEMME